jgi:hypothetical protein
MKHKTRVELCTTVLALSLFILFQREAPASRELLPCQGGNGSWGYVDGTGRFRIRPMFEEARIFLDGLAIVRMHKKYGFIDDRGRPVIKPQFEDARPFSEGLAAVMILSMEGGKKWGFIDPSGRFAIAPKFDSVSDFKAGTAEVFVGDERYRIDRSGAATED